MHPPKQNAEFVCAMEDVLDVYHRDYGKDEVLVCMDETSRQHVKETRVPRPAAPVYDHEYERNGTSNLFMLFAPLEGWRRVEVTERRTRVDWAHLVRDLLDVDYPDKRVVLVMDNLNTHSPGSLYEGVRSGGGAAPRQAVRDPLHAEAPPGRPGTGVLKCPVSTYDPHSEISRRPSATRGATPVPSADRVSHRPRTVALLSNAFAPVDTPWETLYGPSGECASAIHPFSDWSSWIDHHVTACHKSRGSRTSAALARRRARAA